MTRKYLKIIRHYENCLEKFGDTHLGVDWPKVEDVDKRYQIMLELIPEYIIDNITLLDFGCGAAHFYDYLIRKNRTTIKYSGLDLSEKFITLCKSKYPELPFICGDVLIDPNLISNFDYIIVNGVFTERRELNEEEMFDYFKSTIKILFEKCNHGIAFNVMTKHVDWEREDLFHLSFDKLASFLKSEISTNFIFRNDYGLYEYTTYIYKQTLQWQKL